MRKNFQLMAVSFFATVAALAQTPGVDYEKVLLPTVISQPEAGAFGSLWTTTTTITNAAAVPVSVYPYKVGSGGVEPSPTPLLPANTTIQPKLAVDRPRYRGTFLLVDRRHIDDVFITLRAQDLSRATMTFGTAVPVVRESAFSNGVLSMNDVPVGAVFRSTLRVYSLDSARPTRVRLSIYGVTIDPLDFRTDTRIGSVDLALQDLSTILPENSITTPGFLEVLNVEQIMPSTFTHLRVDVEPLDATTRISAFISVTHNDTQHITIITPR